MVWSYYNMKINVGLSKPWSFHNLFVSNIQSSPNSPFPFFLQTEEIRAGLNFTNLGMFMYSFHASKYVDEIEPKGRFHKLLQNERNFTWCAKIGKLTPAVKLTSI